jgi:hypothetical protein
VGSAFEGKTQRRFPFEVTPQGFLSGLNATGLDRVAIIVEHAVMAEPVSKIKTDRDLRLFHPSRSSANLLHWLVSFCTSSACEQINLIRETSRLIPSEGL